jgi:hypothetical protein
MKSHNPHNYFVRRSFKSQLSLWAWWCMAALGLIAARLIQVLWLDPAYVASGYPVPFFVGQTTFNAAELKGYYQVMIDKDTLPLYWLTQCIDFAFIVCTYLAFFALSQSVFHSIKRVIPKALLWQAVAAYMCLIAPLAAVADAAENIFSFIMLLQPVTFPDFLVYPYSAFAVVKFFLFFLTYFWAAIMIATLLLMLCANCCYSIFKPKLNVEKASI